MTLRSVTPEAFKEHILTSGVLEKGTHHEFVGHTHGQKVDMGDIVPGLPEYDEWVEINTQQIFQNWDEVPEAIIGIAKGTNELALDVAVNLGTFGLQTEKYDDPEDPSRKKVRLTEFARQMVVQEGLKRILILEDVGTKGTTAVQIALELLALGVEYVEVQITWPRNEAMERLDEYNIPWRGIIKHLLPDHPADSCPLCAEGQECIPYGQ